MAFGPVEWSLQSFFDLRYIARSTCCRFSDVDDAIEFYRAEFQEGRVHRTHPLFDPSHYATKVADLGHLSPLDHFLQHPAVSPTPYFDAQFYLQRYPDISGMDAFRHFFCNGRFEMRAPQAHFEPGYYREQAGALPSDPYADLDPLSSYIVHYRDHPSLRPHPLIDPDFIRGQMPWAKAQNGEDPLLFYLAHEADGVMPNPFFEPHFYLSGLREGNVPLPRPGESLLAHFLRTAPSDHLVEPGEHFSMRYYIRSNPDVREINPLLHYMLSGRGEGRTIRPNTPFVEAQVCNIQSALEIEPAIINANQSPDPQDMLVAQESWNWQLELQAFEHMRRDIGSFRPTHLFLLSGLRRGGAEKLNHRLMSAILAEDPSAQVLLLATDGVEDDAPGWLVENERLRFARLSIDNALVRETSAVLVARLIEILRPLVVINGNSAVGWRTYRDYGRPLSDITRLRAGLFCYDYDTYGNKVGYARDFLRDTIDHIDLCFIDNQRFVNDLIEDFSLSRRNAGKVVLMHQHFGPDDDWAPRDRWPDITANAGTPKVLWPMRFARQKRPDIFRQVALSMPEVEFHVWTPGRDWIDEVGGGEKPGNVTMLPGTADSFLELDVSIYVALLSTSQWEGLPNVIIEGAAAGLPIVASNVGGVAEIVPKANGYLIEDYSDVGAYVAAIEAILRDPADAETRRERSWAHAKAQHGTEAFARRLRALGFVGDALRRPMSHGEDTQNEVRLGYAARAAGAAKRLAVVPGVVPPGRG